MKTIFAALALLTAPLAHAEEIVQDDAIRCAVMPVPTIPEFKVLFTLANGKFSIGETSPDAVSTTIFWDAEPISFFREPTSVCATPECTDSEKAELALNPYTGSCVEENVEILVWEKFIRVNGQYFQTTNGTSVHTD